MDPELLALIASSQTQSHPDARFNLLQSLNAQLAVADALDLDIVAIRISEAIDQLVEDIGLNAGDGVSH